MCRWIYRPGTNGSHWAMASCDHSFKYLSKIRNDTPQLLGCADFYNGKLCPSCGKIVEVEYTLVTKE